MHQPNDPYAEVRIRYFLSKGHKVYSIVFCKKEKQKQINGLNIIELPNLIFNNFLFVKRFIYGFHICRYTDNIDIFYVINALNCFYLFSSKAKRNVLEVQGSDVLLTPKRYPLIKLYYRLFWRFCDGITQDSQIAQQRGNCFLPKHKVLNEVIEIGIDFDVFKPNIEKGLIRKKYKLGSRPIVFHSRGLKNLYNVDTLIASLPIVKKKYTDVCYMLTGNRKDLDDKTKFFIKDKQLEQNILFCGKLDHVKEMKYYYTDADISISIPSSDSSPFSVYEAMATLTPAVVSDLPWLKSKFVPGKHLSIVPVRDSSALAAAILKLLNNNMKLELDSAYQIVYQRINKNKENEKLDNFFISLLKRS